MSLSRASANSRHQRAEQTRARITDAARELFVSRGYTSTTIADIAGAAGVAPQTVYFVFRSKANVLAAVMDAQIVGDVEPIPLLERPAVKRIANVADPLQRLERIVAVACDVTERVAPLYEMVRGGSTDDDVGELLDRHEHQRWFTLRRLVELIETDVRPDVSLDDAADRLYALLSHEVYWLLVNRRGWKPARWKRWAAAAAAHELLADA